MRAISICSICLFLLTFVFTTEIEQFPQVYLDSVFKGSTCGQVYSDGSNSFILVELGDLNLDPKLTNFEFSSIPIMVFRYGNVAFHNMLYTLNDFNRMYSNSRYGYREAMHDNFNLRKVLRFDKKKKSLIDVLGKPSSFFNYFYKDKVIKKKFKVKVEESGIYCVYIVPPREYISRGIMTAKVTYINSYGYLRYEDYVHYWSLILSSIIGTILFIIMFYVYWFKSSSISIFIGLQKGVLLGCLGPVVVINYLLIIPYALTNNNFPSDTFQRIISSLNANIEFFKRLLMIFVFDYMPLIFSTGYGIVHDIPQDTKSILNIRWKKIANILLLLNILSSTVVTLYLNIPRFKLMIQDKIVFYVVLLSPWLYRHILLLWGLSYCISYIQTGRKFYKFPVFDDTALSKGVIWSFHISSFIFFIPKLATALSALPLPLPLEFNFSFKPTNNVHIDTKLFDGLGNNKGEDVLQNLQHENNIFNRHPFKEWPVDLGYYILFVFVFVVWTTTAKLIIKKSYLKESKKH